MSQEKLGDLLGVTFQQVQKYEKGVNRVSGGRLQRLAEVLNVPVGYFFDEVGTGAVGVSSAGTQDHFAELLSSPEGLRIVRALSTVPNRDVWRKVAELLEAMAQD
jgi:transcriptional regulator with XRE-family HTH domain